jgi:hypothetical protein
MFEWLKDWRERKHRICADADELMHLYGSKAYEEARVRATGFMPALAVSTIGNPCAVKSGGHTC